MRYAQRRAVATMRSRDLPRLPVRSSTPSSTLPALIRYHRYGKDELRDARPRYPTPARNHLQPAAGLRSARRRATACSGGGRTEGSRRSRGRGRLDPRHATAPGRAGPVPVRIYRPTSPGPPPLMLYAHGGGWVTGSLDSHDKLCRILANRLGSIVVAVDYRLAP